MATSVAYKPFGPLASFTSGNGLNLTRSFDNNYWMSGLNVSDTSVRLNLAFGRNGNGALTGVTDNNGGTRNASYTYYNDQRLNTGNGAWGNRTFSYDAAGNLTQIVAGAVTTAINVASTNNRVTTVTNNGTTARTLTYDNNGSVTVDQRVGVPSYQYGYNARGRLATSTKNTSTAAGAYGYDAFDSRVTRQTFGTGAISRHYIFDAEGHLWAEHDAATGAPVREYIWLDDMPLAMVDYSSGTAKTYYIHTGQIGEPLMMTRNNQNAVWDDVMDPYGTATPLGTDSVALDLRYPGQWLQAETGGLAQNWFRDYDASLGRYTEADPLGLEAGPNACAYASGVPINQIDPLGLSSSTFWGGFLQYALTGQLPTPAKDFAGPNGPCPPGSSLASTMQAIENALRPPPLISMLPFLIGPEGEAVGLPEVSAYDTSITNPASRFLNVRTNVGPQEFQSNLQANGYAIAKQTQGPNGPVTVLSNGTSTWTIYTRTSTGMAGAQYRAANGTTIKYSLGGL